MAVTGIILAGGKSQRMGQDKGLVLLDNKPLVTYSIDTLASIVQDMIIIAHDDDYQQFGYKVTPDLIPNSGPLGGIYTGLKQSNTDFNFVLSCDTPFVSIELVKLLVSKLDEYDAVVPRHEHGTEPLAGVYHKRCLLKLETLISNGDLKMRYAIKQLNVLEVDITQYPDIYKEYLFDNINTPEALKAAEEKFS